MKSVFITGASRGLGFEFVRQYLAAGARVFAACRNPENAALFAPGQNDHLHFVSLDLECESDYATAREVVRHNGDKLDILIHNAGIFAPGEEGLETVETAKMLRVFHVNAVAPVVLTRVLLEPLQNASAPRVLSLTSGGERIPSDLSNHPAPQYSYPASKFALARQISILAGDLKARGIIVAGIGPGFVLTDMTRSATPPPTLQPHESVAGMIRIVDALTLAQTGGYFSWDSRL